MALSETDSSIRQARLALASRRRELNDELRRIDQAISALDLVTAVPIPRSVVTARDARHRKRSVVKPAILDILQDRADGMHANDIVEELQRRGVHMSANDPKATVVTALLRMVPEGAVEALGGNRYRIAGMMHDLENMQPTFDRVNSPTNGVAAVVNDTGDPLG